MKTPLLSLVVLSALFAAGCQTPTESVAPVVNQSLTKTFEGLSAGYSDWVEGSEESLTQTRNLRVSLTLPASANVYFLYTNVANNASVQNLAGVSGSRDLSEEPRTLTVPGPRPEPRLERPSLRALRPQTFGINRTLLTQSDIPADPAVGAPAHFVDSLWTTAPAEVNWHPMTLQVKQTDAAAGRTLFVWVVDDCLAGFDANQGSRFKVTQAMAQALADKFLNPNPAQVDIYGLVTGFLGTEWTEAGVPKTKDGQTYTGVIGGNKQIHIVLGDLNPNADPTKRKFGGGLQGYFHGWNNLTDRGSNERILFAIDANSLGNPDLDGFTNKNGVEDNATLWSLSNSYYPNDIVATLAHEFQHMIHYYQKAILNDTVEAAPWINEMASMAVEDLVADQVGFRGPRGLPGNDYSTGDAAALIDDGRLPLFNGTHEQIALQAWADGLDSLPHYSNAYAFGAWLTRNYGGTAFWTDLVQGPGTSIQAVVDTVNKYKNAAEPTQTYASIVRNWGLAVFYGDAKPRAPFVAPITYAVPSGTSFEFLSGSTTYKTGSINLYNYSMEDFDGLHFTDGAGNRLPGPSRWGRAPSTSDTLGAGATWISKIGTGSGAWSRTVTLPPSVVLTVLVSRP